MKIREFFHRQRKTRDEAKGDAIRDRGLAMAKSGDVDGLIHELHHKNTWARLYAAGWLMDLGATAAKAAPALIETLLRDPSPDVRDEAAKALVGIGPRAAQQVFGALMGTRNETAQLMMIKVLREIGPEGLPFLAEALKSSGDFLLHNHCVAALKVVTGYDHEDSETWIRWFDKSFPEWYSKNCGTWISDPRHLHTR